MELQWKSPKPDVLEIGVPLKDAAPGPVTINIHQYGLDKPDKLTLMAYSEAASLDRLRLSAGDTEAALTGNRLDEVAKVSLNGIEWTPADLKRVQDLDRLELKTDSRHHRLEAGKRYTAKVQLRDGRELKVPVSVDPPRPEVTLLSKGTQDEAVGGAIAGSSGKPRRSARGGQAGVLPEVKDAGEFSTGREGGGRGHRQQLPARRYRSAMER